MTAHQAAAQRQIYLDYNASTPIDPAPKRRPCVLPCGWLRQPSSGTGSPAAIALERARNGRDARAFQRRGCLPAAEARRTTCAHGVFFATDKGDHIITTWIEHPAIPAPCRFPNAWAHGSPICRRQQGPPIAMTCGRPSPRARFVSIMHANRGRQIQPDRDCARTPASATRSTPMRKPSARFPPTPTSFGVDLLSIAGHKAYAPGAYRCAVGAAQARLEPLVSGGPRKRAARRDRKRAARGRARQSLRARSRPGADATGPRSAGPVLAGAAAAIRCSGGSQRRPGAPAPQHAQCRVCRSRGHRNIGWT